MTQQHFSTKILADPTAFEEPLLDSMITIITGEDSALEAELLNVIQQGLGVVNPRSDPITASSSVADDPLNTCIRAAKARRAELAKIVKEAIGVPAGQGVA
jgi:exosome complex component RRP43